MYHAWLVFLTWLNFMAILTRKEHWEQLKEAKLWEQLLVAFVLAQLVATAVAYTEFKGELGDVLGAFTIAWSLLGVAAYQPEPFIHYASFASAVVIMAYAFRPHVIQRRVAFVALGDESLGEREPLVGAERV
ncbi:hypothetical protein HK104_008012 [Borealophlyctis nickersoniae]|nr:hypothetical protein HK104_008012 [Borealophlyctis nickersoniae]